MGIFLYLDKLFNETVLDNNLYTRHLYCNITGNGLFSLQQTDTPQARGSAGRRGLQNRGTSLYQ
jgi:hypothetical protein